MLLRKPPRLRRRPPRHRNRSPPLLRRERGFRTPQRHVRHWDKAIFSTVIPAKAGIQPYPPRICGVSWIPAFAGMTQSSFCSRNLAMPGIA
ncbi:hypothetical protein FZ029_01175 [Azospirillum sp. Sh1]|nr:hypothetical protein FZ029_01175 [Azospirillum sp. Sh1]